MRNLLNEVKITRVLLNGAGAASATPTKADVILDMAGWQSVMFVAVMADVVSGSVLALRAAQADVSDTAQMALLAGSAGGTAGAADYDDKLVVLDLVRPAKRFIEAQVFHVTQNAPFDCVIAIQYNPRTTPATQGSTVAASSTLVTPAAA